MHMAAKDRIYFLDYILGKIILGQRGWEFSAKNAKPMKMVFRVRIYSRKSL